MNWKLGEVGGRGVDAAAGQQHSGIEVAGAIEEGSEEDGRLPKGSVGAPPAVAECTTGDGHALRLMGAGLPVGVAAEHRLEADVKYRGLQVGAPQGNPHGQGASPLDILVEEDPHD